MKVLVLGASGMAGHVIATHLEEQGHDVTRVAGQRRATPDTILADLTDPIALERLHLPTRDVVVNAVGVLLPDAGTDQARTVSLNSWLPHHLARTLADTDTRLVHLSTDCVFSGARGGYREDDLPDSVTFYGRSKATGDIVNGKDLTLRQSIIGPELEPGGSGLFHWFMGQTGAVRGYRRARWNGVTTLELARAVDAAVGQGLTGLYHLTPPEATTKHRLLALISDVFDRDVTVAPVAGPVDDKTLVDTRRVLEHRPPGYTVMIRDLRAWIEQHPTLYPHYLPESS